MSGEAITNGKPSDQTVEPGTKLRIEGKGSLVNVLTDAAYIEADDGVAEWTVPEGVHVVGVRGDLTIDVLPPDRTTTIVEVEPDRSYTAVITSGNATIRTLKHRVLAYVDADKGDPSAEFVTPPDIVSVAIDRNGPLLIVETPLEGSDFEPEIDALNAKLKRKGFAVMPRLIQRVAIAGIDKVYMAVDDVGLTARGEKHVTKVSRDTITHALD